MSSQIILTPLELKNYAQKRLRYVDEKYKRMWREYKAAGFWKRWWNDRPSAFAIGAWEEMDTAAATRWLNAAETLIRQGAGEEPRVSMSIYDFAELSRGAP